MIRRPPRSTRTDTLFPYTTLFRSQILPGTAIMGIATQADYPPTGHTRVKRLHDRARYDRATVHAILDAGLLCHVGYVIEGQPYVTPTAYWREGERVYWHGSSASRMLRHLKEIGRASCRERGCQYV